MSKSNSIIGQTTLSICHMAGMIDLAALPLWVGTLMKFYGLTAPQAGLTATTFLGFVVVSSIIFAPVFTLLPHRLFACLGFAIAACAFIAMASLPVSPDSMALLMGLHAIAGIGVGASLSVTHGVIGRTNNPHRLFGIANVAMAVLAIIMFATLPGMISTLGGRTLFQAFAITMGVAAAVSLLFFPTIERSESDLPGQGDLHTRRPLPKAAWLTIGTIICLALNQSVVFAFVERIGALRGFSESAVQNVLIVTGLVNLMPGILAVVLQKRLSALNVGMAGPILQAIFALCITAASTLPLFAVPSFFYVALVIFTTTFMFGLLTEVDTSGRAVAATPAMMMIGSAVGPALGGTVVALAGYTALGVTVVAITCVAVVLMAFARKELARTSRPVTVLAA
jgi:predicted MFS family arabinose efflux permease